MARVRISGWKPGLDSVRAIKEIRARTGLSLAEAKALVDQVLSSKQEVVCDVPRLGDAHEFAQALTKLGLVAQVSETPSVLAEG